MQTKIEREKNSKTQIVRKLKNSKCKKIKKKHDSTQCLTNFKIQTMTKFNN